MRPDNQRLNASNEYAAFINVGGIIGQIKIVGLHSVAFDEPEVPFKPSPNPNFSGWVMEPAPVGRISKGLSVRDCMRR